MKLGLGIALTFLNKVVPTVLPSGFAFLRLNDGRQVHLQDGRKVVIKL
jgi:hypothetical protein